MNTRLAVATHILTFLQSQDGKPAPSELIAASVNTNAALIRRLLTQLAKAGLTTSQMGTGGGALLAKPGDRITLLDVHRAIDENGSVFANHPNPIPLCPVGRNMTTVLNHRLSEVQRAMEAELGQVSIADIATDVSSNNRTS